MTPHSKVPRAPYVDSTLAIMREGYDFIWNRCRRLETEIFVTRVMGRRAVCIHGREAAALFSDDYLFQRHGGVPRGVVTFLFGGHAAHSAEGPTKGGDQSSFPSLTRPAELERLMDITAEEWRRSIHRWEKERSVVLFDEAQRLLTRAACAWVDLPLDDGEIAMRARDLGRLIDAFGETGPRLWRGRIARLRTEAWIARAIDRARRGDLNPAPGTALHVLANTLDAKGQLLDTRVVVAEMLNLLRPTIAVAWYVTFAALALYQRPLMRPKVAADRAFADLFMQEVRRYFPLTPFLGARVKEPFTWRGHRFTRGTLVLLDVHGNHHDPRLWQAPDEFRPERFENWNGGHKQSGDKEEWVTMNQLSLALHFLTRCVTYDVDPKQNFSFDLSSMPTQPKSGFVLLDVRPKPDLEESSPRLNVFARPRVRSLAS